MEPPSRGMDGRGGAAMGPLPVTYAQYWSSIAAHQRDRGTASEARLPEPQTSAPLPTPPPRAPASSSPCRLTVAGAYRLNLTLTPSPHKTPPLPPRAVHALSCSAERGRFRDSDAGHRCDVASVKERDGCMDARQRMECEETGSRAGLHAHAARRSSSSNNKDLVDSPRPHDVDDGISHAETRVEPVVWSAYDAQTTTSTEAAAAEGKGFSDDYAADELVLQAARCYEHWRRCWVEDSSDAHPHERTGEASCVVEEIHVGESVEEDEEDAARAEAGPAATGGASAPAARGGAAETMCSSTHAQSTPPIPYMHAVPLVGSDWSATSPGAYQKVRGEALTASALTAWQDDAPSPASVRVAAKQALEGSRSSSGSTRQPPRSAARATTDARHGLTSDRESPAETAQRATQIQTSPAAVPIGAAAMSASTHSPRVPSSGSLRLRSWGDDAVMESTQQRRPPPQQQARLHGKEETGARSAPAHISVRPHHASALEALTHPVARTASPPVAAPAQEACGSNSSSESRTPSPGVNVHRRLFADDENLDDGEKPTPRFETGVTKERAGDAYVGAVEFAKGARDAACCRSSRTQLHASATAFRAAALTPDSATTARIPSPAEHDRICGSRSTSTSTSSTSERCDDDVETCQAGVARASPAPMATAAPVPARETLIELSNTSSCSSSNLSSVRSESLSRCSSIHGDVLSGSALTDDAAGVAMRGEAAAASSAFTECVNLSAEEEEIKGEEEDAASCAAELAMSRRTQPQEENHASAHRHDPLLHPAALRAKHHEAVAALYDGRLLPTEQANEEIALFLCWSQEVAQRRCERWMFRPPVPPVPDKAAAPHSSSSIPEGVQQVYRAAYARAPRGRAQLIAPETPTPFGKGIGAVGSEGPLLRPAVYVAAPSQSGSSSAAPQDSSGLQRSQASTSATFAARDVDDMLTPSATPARFVQWIAQDVDPYEGLLLGSL